MTAISELWTQNHSRLSRILEDLEGQLRGLCRRAQEEGPDFRFRFTESRLKDVTGIRRTLAKDDCTEAEFWEVNDLLGVRVVVPTANDIEVIASKIVVEQGWEWTRRDIDEQDTGYRAVHLKSLFPGQSGPSVGCEIQIRTILSDAWSFLSKEYFHHRGSQPPWNRAMTIMARQLQASDDQLQFIRDQMAALQMRPEVVSPEVTSDPSGQPSEPET